MQMIEITMDGFIETVMNLVSEDDDPDMVDAFVDMANLGLLDLSSGPTHVYNSFSNHAELIKRDEYEKNFPKYSNLFTWDEFIMNECEYGNDKVAVKSTRGMI